jgi:hypothetical protein
MAKNNQMPVQLVVPIAFQAADALIRSARNEYSILNALHQQSCAENEALLSPAQFVPAVMSSAFAIELFMKGLRTQCGEITPTGHVLTELWQPLPDTIKESAERTYKRVIGIDFKDKRLARMEIFPKGGNAKKTDPLAPRASSFAEAIRRYDDAFVTWRYLYEKIEISEECFYFDFLEIEAIVQSIVAEIKNYKGTHTLKVEFK